MAFRNVARYVNLCGRSSSILWNSNQLPVRCLSTTSQCLDSTPADKYDNLKPVTKTMLPPDTYKGKTVYMTGGGTGFGKSMTKTFSELGAEVAIVSRNTEVLKSAAKEISDQTGNRVHPITANIRDPQAVKASVDQFVELCGGLPDVIINNAAANFVAPTERLSPNAWITIVDVVLNGTMYVTLEIGKRLIKEEKGANFLTVSTTFGNYGSPFVVPSAASKSGIENITRCLAVEWGRYGLRFNTMTPGPAYTEGAMSRLDPTGKFLHLKIKDTPIGRLGVLEEISNLATYICSDYASWFNGENFTMDGGLINKASAMFAPYLDLTKEDWDQAEAMIRKLKDN